eukprot:TRINITY_DN4252_c0_g1_i1.p1 TRINITY_DN4252_c0_g1~~TRINITY_DN4252_c0_g1_i1.p1  ORF type:complete len:506 (-),score=89.67 TRINITY_DN4252_c0_g1_i1:15-1490(-)
MRSTFILLSLSWVCLVLSASPFPPGFAFGTATASYQVEGAFNVDRGLSIWDVFSHTPGKTHNGDTGDVADDSYHKYPEDIALMKEMGIKHYRFSISWNRIFLNGVPPLNQPGVDHYNKLINSLLAAGIEPFVTLYHWDLPNNLSVAEGGWLSETIVERFVTYADACFAAFGDRVKRWITFNEPLSFSTLGYGSGIHAPGRCSDRTICPEGDSKTEPYIVSHNVLRAHAHTVNLYRQKYSNQKGIIGITLNCDWTVPLTQSAADQEAAERHLIWQLSWYADPIFFGDYPEIMKQYVGSRLPTFTAQEKQLLKGSHDYFGLNHYTSVFAAAPQSPIVNSTGWNDDQRSITSYTDKEGKLIGPAADSPWLHVVPYGIQKMLEWVSTRYGKPPIYITENGVDVPGESSLPLEQAINDTFRRDFYRDYLTFVGQAIQNGVDVRGYFAWSLMDNFEWADGYNKRFGLHYVDYKSPDLKRYDTTSSRWFADFIKNNEK